MEEEEGSDHQSCPWMPRHLKNFLLTKIQKETSKFPYLSTVIRLSAQWMCVCICVCVYISRTHLMRCLLLHTHLLLLFTWKLPGH